MRRASLLGRRRKPLAIRLAVPRKRLEERRQLLLDARRRKRRGVADGAGRHVQVCQLDGAERVAAKALGFGGDVVGEKVRVHAGEDGVDAGFEVEQRVEVVGAGVGVLLLLGLFGGAGLLLLLLLGGRLLGVVVVVALWWRLGGLALFGRGLFASR